MMQKLQYLLKKGYFIQRIFPSTYIRLIVSMVMIHIFLLSFYPIDEFYVYADEINWEPMTSFVDAVVVLDVDDTEVCDPPDCEPVVSSVYSPLRTERKAVGSWESAEASTYSIRGKSQAWAKVMISYDDEEEWQDPDADAATGFSGNYVVGAGESVMLVVFSMKGYGPSKRSHISLTNFDMYNNNKTLMDKWYYSSGIDYLWFKPLPNSWLLAQILTQASASLGDTIGSEESFCSTEIQKKRFMDRDYSLFDGTIKIVLEKASLGIRVKMKEGEVEKYIGGCYFDYGRNEDILDKKNNHFVWINWKPDLSVLDYYKFYRNDQGVLKVKKVRFISEGGYNALEQYHARIREDDLDLAGYTRVWEGDPQNGSEDLNCDPGNNCPNDPNFNSILPLGALEEEPTFMIYSPIINMSCSNRVGSKWTYSIVPHELGAYVFPGNEIVFEGPGIIGGAVEGDMTSGTNGAWIVKENNRKKVVFEATAEANFTEEASGFVIYGINETATGNLNYQSVGHWIGAKGEVEGPGVNSTSAILYLLLNN